MNTLSHKSPLFEILSKLNKVQFKAFYGMLVHYWVNQKAFISKQNFFNLWCELNVLCHEVDESFPYIYDHELVKSYCHEHPYYFIDILDTEPVIKLFCKYLDDRLDVQQPWHKSLIQKELGLPVSVLMQLCACLKTQMNW